MPSDSPLRAQIGQKIAEAAHAAGIPVPELAKGTPAEAPPDSTAPRFSARPQPGARTGRRSDGSGAEHAGGTTPGHDQRHGGKAGRRTGFQSSTISKAGCGSDVPTPCCTSRTRPPTHMDRAVEVASGTMSRSRCRKPRVAAGSIIHRRRRSRRLRCSLLKRVEAATPDEPMVLWYGV